MECLPSGNVQDFLKRFNRKANVDRIPLTGGIELTTRCNFKCVHCYLDKNQRGSANTGLKPDTFDLLRTIDEVTDAGCLNLFLTGGEPLLSNDFETIYTHAKKNGLIVTVFTNGSTVTDHHIQLFKELPPSDVEISVYGSTPGTYQRVTGVGDSYDRAMAGIHALHANGIRISLKTVLMDINVHEFESIRKLAETLDANFRFDSMIRPRHNGDTKPLSQRIIPTQAVNLDFQNQKRMDIWKRYWSETNHQSGINDKLFVCGAGRTIFYITADGLLKPCVMAQEPSWDLKGSKFHEGWSHMSRISGLTMDTESPCRNCDLISICGYCPPTLNHSTHPDDSNMEFLCQIGRLRFQKINGYEHGNPQKGEYDEE
jgi:radical SAM protein with 4Fe4S-binding SPASM domain